MRQRSGSQALLIIDGRWQLSHLIRSSQYQLKIELKLVILSFRTPYPYKRTPARGWRLDAPASGGGHGGRGGLRAGGYSTCTCYNKGITYKEPHIVHHKSVEPYRPPDKLRLPASTSRPAGDRFDSSACMSQCSVRLWLELRLPAARARQEGQEAPFRGTTRPPSTCGCSPRVRSGLPPSRPARTARRTSWGPCGA